VGELALALTALVAVGASDPNAVDRPGRGDWCYAPTRALSVSEKAAYVADVGAAARAAEFRWHVPAPILAAMAIQESGYGTTRLAIKSNNVFAFKWPGATIAHGRAKFVLWCQPDRDVGKTYISFQTRADGVDFVARRLSRSPRYFATTSSYWADVQAGEGRKAAALGWLRAISSSYNYNPQVYVSAISRLAADPIGDGSVSLWPLAPTNPTPVKQEHN
jgi:hypothetical protein